MEFVESYMPYISIALLLGIIITVAALPKRSMSTRELAICAMCLAASFALSFIKISPVANGGSITFAAIVPLAIYCYFAGIRRGMLAAFAYSFLQFIQEPYAIGFFQFLLDYTIPFSVFGLIAVLKPMREKLGEYDFVVALFGAYIIRYFSHVISGALYWETPWAASFVYNATYIPLDFVIALVAIVALIQSKTIARLERLYNEDKKREVAKDEE